MIVILMGVSGSGKTTVGRLLARTLNWDFRDADDFNPSINIEKMSLGIPLEDADRIPWLLKLQSTIADWLQAKKNVVLACSALKATYRDLLICDRTQVKLAYLKGDFELISQRLQQRQNHYMKTDLLSSQFDTLEEPQDAIIIDVSEPPEVIVEQIIKTQWF
jgi:gluconokinase